MDNSLFSCMANIEFYILSLHDALPISSFFILHSTFFIQSLRHLSFRRTPPHEGTHDRRTRTSPHPRLAAGLDDRRDARLCRRQEALAGRAQVGSPDPQLNGRAGKADEDEGRNGQILKELNEECRMKNEELRRGRFSILLLHFSFDIVHSISLSSCL